MVPVGVMKASAERRGETEHTSLHSLKDHIKETLGERAQVGKKGGNKARRQTGERKRGKYGETVKVYNQKGHED